MSDIKPILGRHSSLKLSNFNDRDLQTSMAEAQTDYIKHLGQYANSAVEEMENGFSLDGIPLPWGKTNQDITLPLKYISILAGSSGQKKTTLSVLQILHSSKSHKVGFASFEMRVNYLTKMMAAMKAGVSEKSVTTQCVRDFCQYATNRIYCYDQIGDVSAMRVLGAVEALGQLGCKLVVVDSLMMVDLYAKSGQEEFSKQRDFVSALSGLAAIHDMHVMLVAHNRKPGEYQADGRPNKNSVRGSSGITDVAAVVLLCHLDEKKQKLLQDVEKYGETLSEADQKYVDRTPCQRLIVAKNRFNSFQGTIALYQHSRSRQLLGDRSDRAMNLEL
jgi:replicative DNA helicase